ncbi:MAG TPA: DUF4124 domain-containing protein [Usitatibacter sp.]|nr:DUF4124 domain-containing protein [Usitatibacter sp.]
MVSTRPLAFCLALLAALPVQAGVMYKSVGPNGNIMFSDMPPSRDAKLLETRIMSDRGTAQQNRAASIAVPYAERLFVSDEAIARANAQLDQAEHDLAVARRDTWSPRDGIGMVPTKFTAAADERIRVYRNAALAARQALMDLLRERRTAAIANPPEPGSPYVISMVARPY